MNYHFDEVIDRSQNDSCKYDERAKRFGREDVIPLWVADMDFKTAQPILDALDAKVKQGIFGYVSRREDYFEAIVGWQKRRNGWEIPDATLLSHALGVVPALAVLVPQFAAPGDKVLVQPPVYPEFFVAVENAGCEILRNDFIERDGEFCLDRTDFEEKLREGPKCFILCNPHNPNGNVWTREELTAMGELCLKYHVPILSDEIHADLMLWGNRHIPMSSLSPEIAANTITCISVSKTFNLAGLQASTVVFNNREEQAKYDKVWNKLGVARNNPFSLVATIAACNEGEEWLTQLTAYLEGNMTFVRDFCVREIPKVKPNRPQATYLMWLDCRDLGLDDEALFRFMVDKAGLGLNPGRDFHRRESGFMRLNAACPRSVLERAMTQLRDAVNAM